MATTAPGRAAPAATGAPAPHAVATALGRADRHCRYFTPPLSAGALYRVVNPVSTLMFWRWAHGARVERAFVPIERIAPALPVTVIASEDGRFCRHHGIDWQELQERDRRR